jgi:putative ABC transport system permease protein
LHDRAVRRLIRSIAPVRSVSCSSVREFFALLNTFLLGPASISLVVAGVSIFNVVLMSTAERRQEIGVLRAVGVQRRDVLRTLLAEAALLGVMGGRSAPRRAP